MKLGRSKEESDHAIASIKGSDYAIASMFKMGKEMFKGINRKWIAVKPFKVFLEGNAADEAAPDQMLVRAKDLISIEIYPTFVVLVVSDSTRIHLEPDEWLRVKTSFGVMPSSMPMSTIEEEKNED